jgi:hypothetical protein
MFNIAVLKDTFSDLLAPSPGYPSEGSDVPRVFRSTLADIQMFYYFRLEFEWETTSRFIQSQNGA